MYFFCTLLIQKFHIMKIRLVYLMVISLFTSGSFAQNFSVPETDTLFYGQISNNNFACKLLINNDSTDSFPMSWEVESESMASGWEYSICDPVTCHAIGTNVASFILPTSTANRIMNIHYFPNSNYGQSTVTVKLWQDEYPNGFTLLTWTGVISALGLDDQNNYNVYTFVDVAASSIQFAYELPITDFYYVDLFNINGKLISSTQISDGNGQVNLGENLSSGLYVYKLRSSETEILANKVVIH